MIDASLEAGCHVFAEKPSCVRAEDFEPLVHKAQRGFAGVVGGQPIEVEDSAALALRLDNDTFGTMTCGSYLDTGYQTHVQVWGQHGWLRLAAVEEESLLWYSTKDD